MSIKTNQFFDLSVKELRQSLAHRDSQAIFNRDFFELIGKLGFFEPHSNPSILLKNFHALGAGGLDIPFGVSCVAQMIAISILQNFTHAQDPSLQTELIRGKKIGGIANSESGAGTQLTLMKSTASKGAIDELTIHGHKPCFTNGPADVIFFSAWKEKIDVFAIHKNECEQKSIVASLFGFRTGRTGSVTLDQKQLSFSQAKIGHAGEGSTIFRFSFDIERLLIGQTISGAIETIFEETKLFLRTKYSTKANCPQYLQDKLVNVFGIVTNLKSLASEMEKLIESWTPIALKEVSDKLSIFKMTAVENGIVAVTECIEIVGPAALSSEHHLQKMLRDLYCLKFLGGTKELQKISLFDELMKAPLKLEEKNAKQSA